MASKKAVSSKAKTKKELIEEEELLEDDELLEDEDELEEDEDEEESDDDEEELDDDEELDDEDDEDELEEDEDELEDDDEEEEEESDDEDDEDELDDDEDDEDELEDEEDLEDDDDEEEEEAPKKKSSKKSPTKKETKKSPKKSSTKKETKKAPKKAPVAKSFEDYFSEVEEKVASNNGGKVEYVDGVKHIPQSPVISNELLANIIATFDDSNPFKDFIEKMTGKIDKELCSDVKENREAYNVTGNDVAPLLKGIFDAMYEVLKAGSGFKLFNTEECKATLKGELTEAGTIFDCTKLNVKEGRDYSKVVQDYVRIKVNSPAPSNAKVLGTMKGKKFVEFKEETKKSSKKTPAKKTKKK